tara:strand:- start:393 stop:521 length:129 start_codon:yes stop_codon:yes gene_type:complete
MEFGKAQIQMSEQKEQKIELEKKNEKNQLELLRFLDKIYLDS